MKCYKCQINHQQIEHKLKQKSQILENLLKSKGLFYDVCYQIVVYNFAKWHTLKYPVLKSERYLTSGSDIECAQYVGHQSYFVSILFQVGIHYWFK